MCPLSRSLKVGDARRWAPHQLGLLLLLIVVTSSSATSSTSRSAHHLFPTWSFVSPSHRMEWNELPRHIQLQSKVLVNHSVVSKDFLSQLLLDSDVVIIGTDAGDLNTTMRPMTWLQLISNVMEHDNDDEDDEGFWKRSLRFMQQEVKESPTGTLSSATLLFPSPKHCRLSLQLETQMETTTSTLAATAASAPAKLCHVYCLQVGNLTASEEDASMMTSSVFKLARDLGSAIAAAVSKRMALPQSSATLPSTRLAYNETTSIRVFLPSLPFTEAYSELACSFWSALYKDERYKGTRNETTTNSKPFIVELVILDDDATRSNSATTATTENEIGIVEQALLRGTALARGVYLSRDIVNAPHNVLNSLALAETAQRLASCYRSVLSCQVFSAAECERRGMGAFLGVARASETEAQFIHIIYNKRKALRQSSWGSNKAATTTTKILKLGVIGKGLLFDTGGYSIKTQNMEYMKFDCGGAAAILGACRAIAELEPDHVEIHFVVAACENMINERGVVPGDVLQASNGKTIEVLNTDAEGRLTLADALVYVDRDLDCDEIVELSTLTGACVVALGPSVAGLWTKDDGLAAGLRTASEHCGEQIWRMPLVEEYNEMLKSKVADVKNIGERHAGAITAALFLQNFITSNKKPFAHIDMAGPVWDMKLGQATGWGARLVTQWVLHRNER